jgi:hypothetical protein
MHRLLIALTLTIGTAPALALAGGRLPSAAPHPAPGAHATAVAGQADAARMEACSHLSSALLDALDKGDYQAATTHFDSTMRAGLSAQKLRTAWLDVGEQVGRLEARGTPRSFMYQGLFIVTTPMRFARGGLTAQVACNAEGQIAGFYMRPPSSGAAG